MVAVVVDRGLMWWVMVVCAKCWVDVQSDLWCRVSPNASISFLCAKMRRRRLRFRAIIRCTSHGAPWREGRS